MTLQQIIQTSPIKQWNLLLSSNRNKNMLVKFIVDQWKTKCHVLERKVFLTTCGTKAYKITLEGYSRIDMLESNQEEADTRLLLHVENANQDYPNIVINSPDTNVFILALSKCLSIDAHLNFLTVVKDKRKIIDIEAVADKAYQSIDLESCEKSVLLDTLVAYHCFTGCDNISAFAGRGKIKPFVLTCKQLDHIKAFSKLGKYGELPDECLTFSCIML